MTQPPVASGLILRGRGLALCARLLATSDRREKRLLAKALVSVTRGLGLVEAVAQARTLERWLAKKGPEQERSLSPGSRTAVALYETSYETAHGAPGGRPMQLADIAGFYNAFGFHAAGERPDHLIPELEFVALTYFKEAHALQSADNRGASVCLDARQKFVSDHLLKWLPCLNEKAERENPGLGALLAVAHNLVAGRPSG
jgi:hypothetical protein